jgi:hypothetical protein
MALNTFSFFPGRFCVKKTPAPLLAKNSKTIVAKKIGDKIINETKAPMNPKGRLTSDKYNF